MGEFDSQGITEQVLIPKIQASKESQDNGLLSPIETIKTLANRYPEMGWLTGKIEATPEASVSDQDEGTIGKHIYPDLDKKDLIEFDRTAVGILTLQWVINGDYESFTACQKGPIKLTPESFVKLRQYTESVLQNSEDIEAMETFMVINDLGKVRRVIDGIDEKSGINDVDHDKMLLTGVEQHSYNSPNI